eukprot:GILI01022918.1.p1 GENE.GILI01022918.1~~GILI01022918.1.p1  ORF type:complete len:148 (+),score=22.51 GILI01022918.1:188-631(+)
MSYSWTFVAYALLPTPIILGLILGLPLPIVWRRKLSNILSYEFIVGPFKTSIITMILSLTVPFLLGEFRRVARDVESAPSETAHPSAVLNWKMMKWRDERNMYILAFTVTVWFFLHRLVAFVHYAHQLQTDVDRLKKENETLKASRD